ncbi:MAG: ParB/RepB/Spo0J family partition protein [Phycisphaerae bacterium]
MTLKWIPLEALDPHPENANRMTEHLFEKLKGHLERTGRYEPLVVRPLGEARYQILNGHHRVRALAALGHTHARCDVWEVDDAEARLLLATLNRLEGKDDPSARALLLSHLAEGRSVEELSRLLPEPPDAVERLLRLAEPPPEPIAPEDLAPLPRAMTFFLSDEQHLLVSEALRAAAGAQSSRCIGTGIGRAEALERLALWYLEAQNLR